MHPLPDGRLLLAFSGGPDSVGLAARLRDRQPLLAYVDHGLRGPRAARAERARTRAVAHALGLELARGRVRLAGRSEAAARRARYRALRALAAKHGCVAVALAHTADDRAETILFNLHRGTGLRGLAAPLPDATVAGLRRLRPALDERRADLRRAGGPWGAHEDRTNRCTSGARARARNLLLPRLARRLGEDPVPLLCLLGDLAAAVRGALEMRARRLAGDAGRRRLLAESLATFPYLIEALRPDGPPLTARAYASLREFLRAGRRDRAHLTPGGERWVCSGPDGVRVLGNEV